MQTWDLAPTLEFNESSCIGIRWSIIIKEL